MGQLAGGDRTATKVMTAAIYLDETRDSALEPFSDSITSI